MLIILKELEIAGVNPAPEAPIVFAPEEPIDRSENVANPKAFVTAVTVPLKEPAPEFMARVTVNPAIASGLSELSDI